MAFTRQDLRELSSTVKTAVLEAADEIKIAAKRTAEELIRAHQAACPTKQKLNLRMAFLAGVWATVTVVFACAGVLIGRMFWRG